jgi:hypothetical protein
MGIDQGRIGRAAAKLMEDLEQLGEIPPEAGLFAWWRRVLSGRGEG